MIAPLSHVTFDDFSRKSLPEIARYFDLDYSHAGPEHRYLWFNNLLQLAQHDLSLAHCVQHHTYPRAQVKLKFGSQPPFTDRGYAQTIGCFSNFKAADTMRLENHTLSGTKHWISLLEQADFGTFRIPAVDHGPGAEALVIVDLQVVPHKIDTDFSHPIGMTLARPASLTIQHHKIRPGDILTIKRYTDPSQEFFDLTSFSDYCFITNFLGINLGLFNQFKNYLESSGSGVDAELQKIGLELSTLKMMWQDNLASINVGVSSDSFWHKRNTQYTFSKTVLINLITYILKSGNSLWCDQQSAHAKRFRDALTFCGHMKPLHTNLKERHFVSL